MQIPIQLIEPSHILKAIDTRALIDSGASISCLDWGFVRKHSLPTTRLQKPIYARNADNSINSKGVIRFTSTLFLNIEGIARKVTFQVISLGNENEILGLPWLKDVNPTIDWNQRTLSIDESLDQSKDLYLSHTTDTSCHDSHFQKSSYRPPRHTHVNVITDSQLFEYNRWEEESQFLACADTNQTLHRIIICGSRFLYRGFPLEEKISKITTATELAAAAEKAKPKQALPPEFADYTSVFSKEATDHVPPSRPYDHEINLNDSFTPKIRKVYPLSPKEWKATKDFLQENLNCGKIRPSNSPQASPFFFVKKKDGGLCPCQDY